MADFWWGFQGTVDEAQWAKLMAGVGQKYTLVHGDPVRSSGRTLQIDPRLQIGAGVAFEHDAVKSVTVPTPSSGQWHLLVARRTWGVSSAVVYALVAGATTADAVQTVPPTTLPAARNKAVGLVDDEPVAWVHTRASTTTLNIFQMSTKRDGRVPGLWAMFNPDEQGIYKVYSEADTAEYVWSGSTWGQLGGLSHLQLNTTNSQQALVTQYGIGFTPTPSPAASFASKAIVFPKPFASVPVFDASYIGARNTSGFNPTGLADLTSTTFGKGINPTLTGGTAIVARSDGATLATGWWVYYSWRATGVLA